MSVAIWPPSGGGGVLIVAGFSNFPALGSVPNGTLIKDSTSHILYEYNSSTNAYEPVASNPAYLDAITGTSPGGVNGDIQFNNAGSFGGDTLFTTNGAGVLSAVSLTASSTVSGSNLTALGHAIADIPNSLLTTIGDIIFASAASTPARLGIGTTGQILGISAGVPVWETPASSGLVTAVSIATNNGFAGTSSGGSTPILTLSTTLTTPVIAGNGTALIAATTTGTGSTVVLNAGPTFTGTIAAASETLSGTLVATGAISGSNLTAAGHASLDIPESVVTAAGDILFASAASIVTRLAIGSAANILTVVGGLPAWAAPAAGGTVTSVSVVSANGLAGTVATATTTPAITLSTTLTTPVIAGNGTALIAATTTGTGSTVVLNAGPTFTGTIAAASETLSGTLVATGAISGSNLTSAGHASVDIANALLTTTGDTIFASAASTPARLGIGSTGNILTVVAGIPAWSAPATSGTVTSVSVVSANGLAGTVATATTTPAITLSTTLTTPVIAGNGTSLIAATTTGSGSTVALSTSPVFVTPTLGVASGTTLTLGTPSITDTGTIEQMTGAQTAYEQVILQNTTAGATSSTDFIVNNDLGTASTFYGDFGINSSGFTGTGSLALPSATYLYAQSGDLVLATNTANSIHLVANNSATDAITINSLNQVLFPGITGFKVLVTGTGGLLSQINYTSSPNGLSISQWDGNKNFSANNFFEGFTTTATAGSSTTMTITSTEIQVWTGSLNQTVLLPTTSVPTGAKYKILNTSTGVVTVQSSGANTILAIASGFQGEFTALVATPTTAANWAYAYSTINNSTPPTGTVSSFSFTNGANVTGTVTNSTTTPTLALAPTGSSIVNSGLASWDANGNISANNFLTGLLIISASGTTTLTAATPERIYMSGGVTVTIVMPVVSTLALGQTYYIDNQGNNGAVTINSSGGNNIASLIATTGYVELKVISLSGTGIASWQTLLATNNNVGGSIVKRTTGGSISVGAATVSSVGSSTANAAATGVVRLASIDTIDWRNNANTADLALSKNASDVLNWVGAMNLGAAAGTTGSLSLTGTTSGVVTIAPQAAAGTYTFALPTTVGALGSYLTSDGGAGTGFTWSPPSGLGTQPTVSKAIGSSGNTGGFPATGSSGTYTTPPGVQFIRVRMVGAGGGGGGSGVTSSGGSGGNGGNTTFGSSLLVANGGFGGNSIFNGGPGAGGSASLGSGPLGSAFSGSTGGATSDNATTLSIGGGGGNSVIYAGGALPVFATAGGAGISNSGGGGAGGGTASVAAYAGAGGGGGGGVDAIIPAPAATYAYSIGASGTAGAAGTSGFAGGAGSNGYIEVDEFYYNIGVSSVLAGVNPTVQTFSTPGGPFTYTKPAGVQFIQIEMVGGGGGGGGSGTGAPGTGGVGGNSTFGNSLLVANGGSGGGNGSGSNIGGAGGTASLGTGPIGTAITGATASGASGNGTAVNYNIGTGGGSSPFGGSGAGADNAAGGAASTNSGSGGGGAGCGNTVGSGGCGGGASGYISAIITSPSATYPYVVGGGGTAGTAGTTGFVGGAGGSGYIRIVEYYSAVAVGTSVAVTANQVMAGPASGAAASPVFRALVNADMPPSTAAIVGLTTGYTIAANAVLLFDTKLTDTDVAYSTSTGLFTAPFAGQYSIQFVGGIGTSRSAYVKVNGTAIGYLCTLPAGGVGAGGITVTVTIGQTIGIYIDGTGALTGSGANGYLNWMSICRIK